MRSVPAEIDTDDVVAALADGWGFDVADIEYAPVGAGSYHWVVRARDGTPAFVTVDDLDAKPWLGETHDGVFANLRRAFDTAVALRDAGLQFVVAPFRTINGNTVRRLGPHHAVALVPFVDGVAGEFGPHADDARVDVIAMLARLHGTTPAGPALRLVGVDVPGRRQLEAALRELGEPWTGGPFSEPARHALAAISSDVAELLAFADRLAADVRADWVVTHGEPHAGNVLAAGERRLLVDWDTVALAPPERDLWLVVETAADKTAYAEATGRPVDETALSFFRVAWDLNDLAAYLTVLRSPHAENDDTAFALAFVSRFEP
jgi:spectinomycin phosphotransferase